HAVVDRRHNRIRLTSDDRAGGQFGAARARPDIVQTSQTDQIPILTRNTIFQLRAFSASGSRFATPLEERRSRHETTLRTQWSPEGWFLGYPFGASIDHLHADCWIFRPGGDEAPFHQT